ncbi:flagellar protein FliS [Sphingomonas sp. SORGH_AS802]|jgi:flagellar protein FliS|uniref:flagellar protein FliS n=1 Tax=unclassified Sphingomonas TaxID=196159 RepID=UPI0028545026|nr:MULTISPECIES: flagellar protein FliS [unclassified Sphingomonas]MDR6128850.1 flagellar protein FliS [Sphingomonas sp. SORGH_AS_0438]MDR6136137.1 flagellar protein FliS [Sphingomonas sp. SORGH_AS_0802]
MAYASTLLRDPWATYREIDAAGRTAQAATGPKLVQLLYAELVAALRAAACAAEHRQHRVKSDRVTRATAILFALETGLDFDQGGEVSKTLARLYAGTRAQIVHAALDDDPTPFRATADSMAEIAAAWASISAA